jgi:hypothetical protein
MSREWRWLYDLSLRWKWLDRELIRWFPMWWLEISLYYTLADEIKSEIDREIIEKIKQQMETK